MSKTRIEVAVLCVISALCILMLSGCHRPKTRTEYDKSGRISAETYRLDDYTARTEYTYDESGNLVLKHTTKRYGKGEPEPLEDIHYFYDDLGRCTKTVTMNGSGQVLFEWRSYYFDGGDLLEKEERYDAEGVLMGWNEYQYTNSGTLAAMHQYQVTDGLDELWRSVYYSSDGQAMSVEEYHTDEPMKLSGEVLKEMRDHYPYCQTATATIATLPEEYWVKGADVFAVVELTEDRKETTRTEYPNPSVDPNLTTEVTAYYFPAKVLEILDIRDGCSLTGEEITLSFPGLLYDPNIAFGKGQRLVLFGTLDKSGESEKELLEIGPVMSFYLTDEKYVLSLSSNAQMDQFSGWKLETLEEEMLRITEAGGWH